MSLLASRTFSGVTRLAAPRWSSGPHSDGHQRGPMGVSLSPPCWARAHAERPMNAASAARCIGECLEAHPRRHGGRSIMSGSKGESLTEVVSYETVYNRATLASIGSIPFLLSLERRVDRPCGLCYFRAEPRRNSKGGDATCVESSATSERDSATQSTC